VGVETNISNSLSPEGHVAVVDFEMINGIVEQ
jgi:hypothetical protein